MNSALHIDTSLRLEDLTIEKHGCSLLSGVLAPDEVSLLANDLTRALDANDASLLGYRDQAFGARNLATTWSGWRALVDCQPIRELLCEHVSESFGLVRILYFDKPPGHGWSLPWHRDQTIAVKEHIEPLAPFSKPTTKAGVPHVEATPAVLGRMLTLRLSLDPMTVDNGPLLFIPGSHDDMSETLAMPSSTTVKRAASELRCDAGDVFAMRPRTIHASRDSNSGHHRRVVHMEFAPPNVLPHPWQWHTWETV